MLIVPSYLGLWLLQITCILFPTVLYQSYFRKRFIDNKTQSKIFAALSAFSILICMTFPVSINNGYILDFRFIPLIIAFIYFGFRIGLFLSIIIIGYRFIIGGIGFYLGGLWMAIALITIFWFILPRLKNWDKKWQKLFPYFILIFTLIFFALGTQYLGGHFTSYKLQLWCWFSVLNFLTLWMVIHLQNSFREMESLSEKVIQFEKNHTINHLLVYISQQMLTPIKSTGSFLQLIEDEPLSTRQTYQLLQAKNELSQAERSLDYFLTFMDEKWKEVSEMSFVNELQEVVGLMKSYAEVHQVDLIYTSTADDDIAIKGDPTLLRFALMNIIKNAIEACSPKGRVNICLHEMLKDVYIVIEDNGMGIPPQILKNLGKPLSSGKVNGTGLGLASTFKIAESMGGRVEVESNLNKGTIFSLYFPKWGVEKA